MRVFDDMRDNASTFYAELKRLETVLKAVKGGEKVFLLLDEILRGTNSHDRHQGSLALIKQLVKDNAHGIIATHDIGLSELANTLPDRVKNFHFDARVDNEELYFDYKMHHGVCQSFNASLLLRKLGLDVN
jgi:DNA mismatch repair ATPase MutS